MDDLVLKKGSYHALTFESSYHLKLFKQKLFAFFNNKSQLESEFVQVLDETNNQIKPKKIHFISFDCNSIDLTSDKNTEKQIQNYLYHQLENNPKMVEDLSYLHTQLINFTNNLAFVDEQLSIEFNYTEKAIKNLIKSFEIIIEHDNTDYTPNYKIRDFLIKALLKMNTSNKEPFLIISSPETDVAKLEFDRVINLFKQTNVTIIVLSCQQDFLTAASDKNLFLINEHGNLYDIINLRKELISFQIINKEDPVELARLIAIKDFNKDYLLLDSNIKEFLQSSAF